MPPKSSAAARVPLPPERAALVADLARRMREPGAVVVVVGEGGVGKSTILDAALTRATHDDPRVRVLFARAVRPGIPAMYLGLHELFADVDVAALGLPPAQRDALEVALGLTVPAEEVPAGAVLAAAWAAVRALAGAGPVVVVVDDLDGLDVESAHVVRYLASRRYPPDRAPAFVFTQQDERAGVPAGAHVVAVPALGRTGVRALLRDRTGAVVPAVDAERVHALSRGNPMWAIEIACRGSALGAESLDDALRDRIEHARPASRRVLQTVAALGEASSVHVLGVLGASRDALSDAVDDELVVERDGVVAPAHPVLGSVALAMLGDRERKDLHARIAGVVDGPDRRADHLDRATDTGPDAALARVLADAAVHARMRGALLEALDLAARSVRRVARDDTGHEATAQRLLLAEIAFAYGDYDTTLDALEAVAVGDLDNERLDRALPLLVTAAAASRGHVAARATLRAIVHPTHDPVRRAIFDTYRAESHEDPDATRALAQGAVEVLRAADAAPLTRHRALGVLVLDGVDAGRGLDDGLLEESARLEPHIRLLAVNDSALSQRGLYAYQLGDLEGSRTALEAARAIALERGEEVIAGIFALHLAVTELYAGRRARADEWLAAWNEIDPWPDTPPPIAVTAFGMRALRDGDEADLRRIVDAAHGPGSEEHGRLARLTLTGWAAARDARWESAVTDLTAARALAEAAGIREPGRRLWLDFALAHGLLAIGEADEALRIAGELERLSAGRRSLLDGIAARVRALAVAQRDPREALRLLRASAKRLRHAGFPSEQAITLFELAMACADVRDRDGALRALEDAAGVARAASDVAVLRLIEAARSATTHTSVDASLTARERAVAWAAARGATNREIAGENHLSVRTVESQLSSAYRKLGVRSRSELTALLRTSD